MPTITGDETKSKNPLHWYMVTCDSCDWHELSGPYHAGTDEDVKANEFAERSLEKHASENRGHRTTLYLRMDGIPVRTFIDDTPDDFQQEMVRS